MNNGFLTVREESEKWVSNCNRIVKNGFPTVREESE